MKLLIDKSFEKNLIKIKDKSTRHKTADSLEGIINASSLSQIKGAKKLKGFEHFYRIKLGEFSLGFSMIDGVIIALRILHRNDKYKYFPKQYRFMATLPQVSYLSVDQRIQGNNFDPCWSKDQ